MTCTFLGADCAVKSSSLFRHTLRTSQPKNCVSTPDEDSLFFQHVLAGSVPYASSLGNWDFSLEG